MSDRTRIRDFIIKAIARKAALPAGEDLDRFNYIDSGHVDSIGIIKFVLELEREFEIDIAPEEMESDDFRTIGGLVELIQQNIANK